jgi:FkbM family methyltransferase
MSIKKYNFYSQQGEDLLIYRNFINNKLKDGIFLELGACDGLLYSNTLFFEKELGFKGILIEPIKEMYTKLLKNRKGNICYNNAICTNKNDVEILVNGPVSGIKDSMKDTFIKAWHKKSKKRYIKTKTLSDIFKENNIKYIDLFSLDVEGAELEVLKTINWNEIQIYLICIELDSYNELKNKECRKLLQDNGFIFKVKMCINEFWINPTYFRKDILFTKKNDIFTGNMNDYGKHIYLEPHCKSSIENTINNFKLP